MEDDHVSAAALAAILRRRGFEVVIAPTVAQALHLLDQHPQIVLLDLMLPDGDGSIILRKIRDRQLPIRVLVTTAANDPDQLAEVQSLHPDAVMKKPLDLPGLLKAMEPSN